MNVCLQLVQSKMRFDLMKSWWVVMALYTTAKLFYDFNGFTGLWSNKNWGYDHKFICKRSDSVPVNTTVAPTVIPKGGCPSNWKKCNSKVSCHLALKHVVLNE